MICKNCASCPCHVYPQLKGPIDVSHRSLLVIGESISAVEAARNSMMSGRGTEVLIQAMQKVGLPTARDQLAFTIALPCAIPKKKGANAIPSAAMSNCHERLIAEIKQIKPKLILVCGKVPWQTLTGDYKCKITEIYGRATSFDWLPDTIVLPIMNPNLILRAPNDYKPFLAQLQLAATLYEGGSAIDTGTTHWCVLDTEKKCDQALEMLNLLIDNGALPYVGDDTETTSLDYRVAEVLVWGICYKKNKVFVLPRSMMHRLSEFLELKTKHTWQNGKYDNKVIWRRKLGTVHIDEDTEYMHYVLDETSSHDLGYLTKTFLNAAEYKYKMNQQWKSVTLESYPQYFEALCERVAVDCDYTYQLVDVLHSKISEEPGLVQLYNTWLIPVANFLCRVEHNGMLINPFFLEEMDKKYDIVLDRIREEIQDEARPFWDAELYKIQAGAKSASEQFNPGSPKQMAWMVFDRLRLHPRIHKAKSTSKEILASIDPQPKLIQKVLEFRTVQKEQSTYVRGLLNARDDDGRVRTTFQVHVTHTGRLSSREPNIQNQPAAHGVGNIRQAFIPRPGYVYADIDYSSAELRWLAFLSHCPVLSEVFIQGRNLHKETATALFGLDYTPQQKMRAKAVNFGIPYGREAKSLADEFNISVEEAQSMIDGWLDNYYGARDYLQWCADQVREGNYLETPFHRRRRFGLVTPESLHGLQNEAKNFPIQGSSSDLLCLCAMDCEEKLLREYNTYEDNLVHDSFLMEIPAKKEIIAAVGIYANSVMVNKPRELFDCNIPFKTDFEIGCDWGHTDGTAFNCETMQVEIEEKQADGSEIVVCYDFDAWFASHTHTDVYKQLQLI